MLPLNTNEISKTWILQVEWKYLKLLLNMMDGLLIFGWMWQIAKMYLYLKVCMYFMYLLEPILIGCYNSF